MFCSFLQLKQVLFVAMNSVRKYSQDTDQISEEVTYELAHNYIIFVQRFYIN